MNGGEVVVGLGGMALPIALVTTILTVRHLRQRREWAHRERMRALEAGQSLPRSDAWPALAAIALGTVGPIGVFGCAWLSELTGGAGGGSWFGATCVALAGVVGGSKLGLGLLADRREARAESSMAHTGSNGKPPAYDPESFDAIARRG